MEEVHTRKIVEHMLRNQICQLKLFYTAFHKVLSVIHIHKAHFLGSLRLSSSILSSFNYSWINIYIMPLISLCEYVSTGDRETNWHTACANADCRHISSFIRLLLQLLLLLLFSQSAIIPIAIARNRIYDRHEERISESKAASEAMKNKLSIYPFTQTSTHSPL